MAIEPIKKVTIISPNKASKRLMRVINRLGVMEVADLEDSFQLSDVLEYHEAQTTEEDEHLHKIDFILSFMNIFSPEEQSFAEGLTPLPLVTTEQELALILRKYDLEEKYRTISDLDETYRGAERVIGEIKNELAELEPIKDLPFDLQDFYFPKRMRLLLGYVPKKNLHLLDRTIEPWTKAAWEEIKHEDIQDEEDSESAKIKGSHIRMLFAFLAEDTDDIRKALSSVEFDEIQLPKVMERIIDRIHELKSDLSAYKEKVSEVSDKIKLMTEGQDPMKGHRPLKILKAYWQNSKEKQIASARGIQSKWVHVIGGYIRKKDIDTLNATLKQELPESEVTIQDPGPDENVPVSLSVPHLFRPMQLLVEMFGLPPYRAFDPTPFLQINFYLFLFFYN
ncbi:MAG: hypothetical protein CVT98_04100 [Bacteroidetes bacterium HGW-Bacteroidetes-15]|nr:MAG: hypothetical protein CVT98_04100 [Bacteroidetes bacterium HGW-Bacteroidetes-15]